MARINVEDEFFIDPRFKRLVAALDGDEDRAIGMVIRAWRHAQNHWRKGEQPIPFKLWDLAALDLLVEVGLARREDDGIYCAGSREQFEWCTPNAKAVAGRVGGLQSARVREERYGSAIPPNAPNAPKHDRSTAEAPPKQAEAASKEPRSGRSSLSLSLSLPHSPSQSEIETNIGGVATDRADLDLATHWLEYAKGVTPSLRANVAKWADTVRLLRERDGVPLEEVEQMLLFVREDDFWRDKALSLEGLRKLGRNGLRKFENIRAAMQRSRPEGDIDWSKVCGGEDPT